jgi:hypothetical protein
MQPSFNFYYYFFVGILYMTRTIRYAWLHKVLFKFNNFPLACYLLIVELNLH